MRIKGWPEIQKSLNRLKEDFPQLVKDEIEAAGRLTEYEAKQRAPVDTGKLRQSITYEPTKNGFGAKVTANVPYAPYIEFGTGGLVDVPDGWDDLAIQFKGRGIRTVNLPARPYLIPAFQHQVDDFFKRIDQHLKRLT